MTPAAVKQVIYAWARRKYAVTEHQQHYCNCVSGFTHKYSYSLLLVSGSKQKGNSTVIASVLGAKTPQYGGAVAVKVNRSISLGIMTITTRAHSLTTTIVIRHKVVASINRVATRANPGNG
jgi:uncharacterized protein (UPF0303 family)